MARGIGPLPEMVERTAVPIDAISMPVIDYTRLLLHWKRGGLSFVALQTGKALRAQGAACTILNPQALYTRCRRLLLRLGRHYPGKKTWGPAHMNWLMQQKLEHREQRIAFEELLDGVRQEAERVERLEQSIREAVPEWSLAEVATALQAMRGIDLVAAATVLAEIGDLCRFQNPRVLQLW